MTPKLATYRAHPFLIRLPPCHSHNWSN